MTVHKISGLAGIYDHFTLGIEAAHNWNEERFLWLLDQLLATNDEHPYRQRRILGQALERQYISMAECDGLMEKHRITTMDKGERRL